MQLINMGNVLVIDFVENGEKANVYIGRLGVPISFRSNIR